MIALDTRALIDLWKNDPKLRDAIAKQTDQFCTTKLSCDDLTYALDPEILDHQEEFQFYESLMEDLVVIKHNPENWWGSNKNPKEVGEYEALIARILQENGVNKILTRNKAKFNGVPGLEVISY